MFHDNIDCINCFSGQISRFARIRLIVLKSLRSGVDMKQPVEISHVVIFTDVL